ncbi:XdhC family protein [Zoogloea sp.]|uniref:XdhC family protein n=1 Tax=Zoogloea sp. TaxID=49181 RepID=UPI00260D19FA|nr:XdhC family protein [Zoogloea sp.]MDD3355019.1 XdhC family protein [Zoogloea sp.]
MDSQDLQVLGALGRWQAEGCRGALVTVARTWGSAPRPAGAWMALGADGRVQGSVSGGCVEDDLMARMRAGEFAGTAPVLLRYGVSREDAARFGLPCGGTLELLLEPAPDPTLLAELAARIAAGQLVRREVELTSGEVRLGAACRGDLLAWDGRCLATVHGPLWRLLIIGAGQIARYLAPMAQALDYAASVCDPREEYAREWDVPGVPLLAGMPDDVVVEMGPDPHTAIVALTHDPKLDDMALLEALKSPAFYVGALGSRVNNQARRERLLQYFDLSAGEVARLHGPTGLPIGSRTPPEIAVSILAEMTAVKNGVALEQPRGRVPASAGCGVG